jgi:3-oxoacyl-[acyl-carrier protein] reductase
MTTRLAVVSGGGTGIGAACARRLAAAGNAVLIIGRRQHRLDETAASVRAAGGVAHCTPADVTDPDQVQALAERIRTDFGAVEILVNNAGAPAVPERSGLAELADAWLQTYRVNTVSAVLLTTALEPLLRTPGGRVVMIGSRAAQTGAASPAYVAAKAALEGYVRAAAARLGARAITVNLVAPGFTEDTELTVGRISQSRRSSLLASVTLGRPGTPDEIAAVVAFLASPDAGYITGEVVTVDGGSAPWRTSGATPKPG